MGNLMTPAIIKLLKYANEFQYDLFFLINYIKEHTEDDFLRTIVIENENKWIQRGLKVDA